jgi:hypothetical protein
MHVLQAKDAGGSGAEQLPRKLHISKLTRNVSEEHVREIFAHYGAITSCALAIDERVQLSKGYAGMQTQLQNHSRQQQQQQQQQKPAQLAPGRCRVLCCDSLMAVSGATL